MPALELQEPKSLSLASSPDARRARRRYAVTIFCGAFLLFQVQLVLGKYILPWFGGTPAVWTTCMLFFQLLLLGGYLYSHLVSKLEQRQQAVVQAALLILSVVAIGTGTLLWKTPLLPGTLWWPSGDGSPILAILGLLSVAVGLPYLCLSTNGPLLQHWFARAHPGQSPYRLYALSNLGSLLGLVTYPVLFEPEFRLHVQAWMWAAVYVVFVVGFFVCARDIWGIPNPARALADPEPADQPAADAPLLWFLLPALASVMLLATTNLLCQEVAVVPFLWVLPLGIYLLSFIICFDNPKWYRREIWQLLMAAGLPLSLLALIGVASIAIDILLLSLVLLGCCMVCHGELVRLKPPPASLTRFYLLVASGGAAGGIFVALIAPYAFTGFWEFHLGLIGCAGVAIFALSRDHKSWWYFPKSYLASVIVLGLVLTPELVSRYTTLTIVSQVLFRYKYYYYSPLAIVALIAGWMVLSDRNREPVFRRVNAAQFATVAALLVFAAALAGQVRLDANRAIHRDRNFYGSLMIKRGNEPNSLALRHGQITHGYQGGLEPKEPTMYFSRLSGIGRLLQLETACSQPCPRRFGILGLGVGTLAAYGRGNDTVRFYEINPQVIAYSQGPHPYFTFLRDSSASIEIVDGDGRLSLERELRENGSQNYDVLVVDAFSSDSIPVHLLTQEAIELYLKHLRGPDSVLAFHISNRALDLRPILSTLAAHNHLAAIRLHKTRSRDVGELSDWVLLARDPSVLANDRFWDLLAPMPPPDEGSLWTDDYTNLFRVVRY
jgi:hypothetical protein